MVEQLVRGAHAGGAGMGGPDAEGPDVSLGENKSLR